MNVFFIKGFFDISAAKRFCFYPKALIYLLEPVRYAEILEDLKKDPESHGGPPDCIVS